MITYTTITGAAKALKVLGTLLTGFTLKKIYDCLRRENNNANVDSTKAEDYKPSTVYVRNNSQLFYLETIHSLLTEYGVAPSDYKAFHVLLDRIEHQEYKRIIEQSLSSVNNIDTLRNYVENQTISPIAVMFNNGCYGPSVTVDDIEKEARDRGFSPLQGETLNDMMKYIINCAKTKSLIDFTNKFGERINKILENDTIGLDCNNSLKSLKTDLEMEQILNNY